MKKKLLVVCGGQSSEHSISRISCNSVMKHLDKDKYEITLVGIAKDGKWYILKQEDNDLSKDTWLDGAEVVEGVFDLLRSQDVAFPVLHGLYGEDGTIQGLFELAQLPYVGCRVFASSACMDKIFAKKVFESAGIPQVKSVYVKKRNDGRLVVVEKDMEETEEVEASIMKELGMPCFIKASRSGSSVGCYRCDKVEDLLPKLEEAAKYDNHVVVEECVDCIELETAVLGNDDIIVSRVGQIMPHGEFYTFESKYEDAESKTCIPAKVDEEIQEQIRKYAVVEECVDCIELETAVLGNDDIIVSRVGQIMPHGEFYTFESKYEDAESKTCIPAKVDEEIQEQIRKYAVRAFKAIDGHGLSRVDFFLDKKTNHVYLNEINTLPGFTSISMYPQLMEDYGYSYSELLDKLIEIADEN